MNQNSEKICRASRHNIQRNNGNIFVTSDSVYFHLAYDRRWRGPAAVLRKERKQVLAKHGGIYVSPHPCQLAFEHDTRYQEKKSKNQTLAEA